MATREKKGLVNSGALWGSEAPSGEAGQLTTHSSAVAEALTAWQVAQ